MLWKWINNILIQSLEIKQLHAPDVTKNTYLVEITYLKRHVLPAEVDNSQFISYYFYVPSFHCLQNYIVHYRSPHLCFNTLEMVNYITPEISTLFSWPSGLHCTVPETSTTDSKGVLARTLLRSLFWKINFDVSVIHFDLKMLFFESILQLPIKVQLVLTSPVVCQSISCIYNGTWCLVDVNTPIIKW